MEAIELDYYKPELLSHPRKSAKRCLRFPLNSSVTWLPTKEEEGGHQAKRIPLDNGLYSFNASPVNDQREKFELRKIAFVGKIPTRGRDFKAISPFKLKSWLRFFSWICNKHLNNGKHQRTVQARSHGVAWGDKCHPWKTGYQLLANPGSFFAYFLLLVYHCSKGEIWNFGRAQPRSLWYTRKLNLFLYTNYQFDCDNMKYTISLWFCTTWFLQDNFATPEP